MWLVAGPGCPRAGASLLVGEAVAQRVPVGGWAWVLACLVVQGCLCLLLIFCRVGPGSGAN